VARGERLAKFWLAPIRTADNHGFKSNELNRIAAIARENEAALLKAWHEYFSNGNRDGNREKRSGD
jgi:hypothetical protein